MRKDWVGNVIPSNYEEYLEFCIKEYGENSGAAIFIKNKINVSKALVGGENEEVVSDHKEMLSSFDYYNELK